MAYFKWILNRASLAKESTIQGLSKLKENDIALQRPADYFAEMYKSDRKMQKIRRNLVNQKQKLEYLDEKRLRKQNKKFQRQMLHYKEVEKSKEKKRNYEAIAKYKEELKRKGENAKDISTFFKKK